MYPIGMRPTTIRLTQLEIANIGEPRPDELLLDISKIFIRDGKKINLNRLPRIWSVTNPTPVTGAIQTSVPIAFTALLVSKFTVTAWRRLIGNPEADDGVAIARGMVPAPGDRDDSPTPMAHASPPERVSPSAHLQTQGTYIRPLSPSREDGWVRLDAPAVSFVNIPTHPGTRPSTIHPGTYVPPSRILPQRPSYTPLGPSAPVDPSDGHPSDGHSGNPNNAEEKKVTQYEKKVLVEAFRLAKLLSQDGYNVRMKLPRHVHEGSTMVIGRMTEEYFIEEILKCGPRRVANPHNIGLSDEVLAERRALTGDLDDGGGVPARGRQLAR
ncbi:hypothetical protein FN846DRAFT_904930 [Sphaerosporella brunnea]|uniref:Uncharacterized protein n=1 Tax=Sphaerosporella brunnea TaxID=1250544 RepID=A0A5J5F2W1_9PEZI|nr:hypothetical protein FN846DRAFT_904930 [Sphaerosporella brunnea]